MEGGKLGDTINPWSVAMFRSLQEVRRDQSEQSAYDKWLDQTSDREEARRDRLHGAAGVIPTSVWIVLLLAAASHLRLHAVLRRPRRERPLAGDARRLGDRGGRRDAARHHRAGQPVPTAVGNLRPVAMERTLRLLDEARAVVGDVGAAPCDEEGQATGP